MNAPEPDGIDNIRFRWSATTSAPPEAVYATLADLSSAMTWSGEQMPKRNFRLLSLQAPPGSASVGTEWTSTGADPAGGFDDRSIVVVADSPRRFVYRTSATYTWKKGGTSTAELKHSWEIEPEGSGSRVTYLVLSTGLRPWKPPYNVVMGTPGLRQLAIASVKTTAGKAFANFIRLAEAAAVPPVERVA